MQRFVQKVYFEQAPAQRAVRDRGKFPELVEKKIQKVSGHYIYIFFRYLLQYRRVSFSKIYFILPAISNK